MRVWLLVPGYQHHHESGPTPARGRNLAPMRPSSILFFLGAPPAGPFSASHHHGFSFDSFTCTTAWGKAAARLREKLPPQQTSPGPSGRLPLLRRLHRRARHATHVSYRTLHVVPSDASGGGTPRRRTRNLSACRRRASRQWGKHVERGRASGSVVSPPRKHCLVHAGCRRGRRIIPRV